VAASATIDSSSACNNRAQVHRGGIEQVGVVITIQAQSALRLDHVQEQVEVDGALLFGATSMLRPAAVSARRAAPG